MTIGPNMKGGKRMITPRSLWADEPREHYHDARAMAFIASIVTIGAVLAMVAVTGQEVGR